MLKGRWAIFVLLSAGLHVSLAGGTEIKPVARPSLEIASVPDHADRTLVKYCDGFTCSSLLPEGSHGFTAQQWREVGRECVGYALYGRDHARQQKKTLSTLAFLTGQGWIPVVFGLLVSGGVTLLPEPELDSADAKLLLDRISALTKADSGVYFMEALELQSLARAIKTCAKNVKSSLI